MNLHEVIKEALYLDKDVELKDEYDSNDIEAWDSIGHVNILTAIEENYGISISMNQAMKIKNIADIRKIINDKQK